MALTYKIVSSKLTLRYLVKLKYYTLQAQSNSTLVQFSLQFSGIEHV